MSSSIRPESAQGHGALLRVPRRHAASPAARHPRPWAKPAGAVWLFPPSENEGSKSLAADSSEASSWMCVSTQTASTRALFSPKSVAHRHVGPCNAVQSLNTDNGME